MSSDITPTLTATEMCAVHTYGVFHQKDTTFCDVTLTAYRGIFKEVMSSNRHQDQLCITC